MELKPSSAIEVASFHSIINGLTELNVSRKKIDIEPKL